ncbi:MAG: diguanylate cyclase [Smithellaceae bacterium]
MTLKKIQDLPSTQDKELLKDNSPQIMIVDDVPEILKMLTDILNYHGYSVLPFTSGEAALKSITAQLPDLILLDVSLSDMDGYAVCNRLKSNKKTSKVPVIFISGHNDLADKIKGFNTGGVDYITKPFQMTEVIARIKTHLSLCHLQRQLEGQNIHLQKEITERKQVEKELLEHKTHLEEIVAERTVELKNTNEELQWEIAERKHLEEALEIANYKLHSLVYEYGLRNQRISLFNKISEQLQTCISVEETYPIISHFIKKLFHSAAGAIFILDERDNLFKAATVSDSSLLGEKAFNADDCLALRKREMHISLDSQPESCCRHLALAEDRSSLCIPVIAQGKTLGVLHLQQRSSIKSIGTKPLFEEPSEGINIDTKQLATTMADFFALALVNIKLRETLKQQATRDPLTGLFNRRYMEETLNREISRAERQKTSLGIIMLDLDHFRRFNNAFGHEAGDLVLQKLGKFLKDNIRAEDIACRYGGEEFTLILPGASLEIAQKRAENIQNNIQNLQLDYNGKQLDTITFSLGIANFPDHGRTGEAVLQAADMAMYRAKRSGRKRIKLASNAKPASKKIADE